MNERRHFTEFWILWVVLSGIGGAFGTALAVVSVFVLGYGALFSFGIPHAIVLFLSIGMAQSLVLKSQVPRLTWWTWPVTTAVFGIIGVLVGLVIFFLAFVAVDSTAWTNGSGYFGIGNAQLIGIMLAGLSGGGTIGFGQGIVLSDYLERSGLLIPINALAWSLGVVLAVFLTLSLPGVSWVVARGASYSIDLPRLIGLGAVTIALISTIQGAALVWLIRKTRLQGDVLTLAEQK